MHKDLLNMAFYLMTMCRKTFNLKIKVGHCMKQVINKEQFLICSQNVFFSFFSLKIWLFSKIIQILPAAFSNSISFTGPLLLHVYIKKIQGRRGFISGSVESNHLAKLGTFMNSQRISSHQLFSIDNGRWTRLFQTVITPPPPLRSV